MDEPFESEHKTSKIIIQCEPNSMRRRLYRLYLLKKLAKLKMIFQTPIYKLEKTAGLPYSRVRGRGLFQLGVLIAVRHKPQLNIGYY